MNAPEVKAKLSKAGGRAAALAKASDDNASIAEVYAAALSRTPRESELKTALEFLRRPRSDAKGVQLDPAKARTAAYEDLLWALINTKEFLYNH
jgi:hypothetical protein